MKYHETCMSWLQLALVCSQKQPTPEPSLSHCTQPTHHYHQPWQMKLDMDSVLHAVNNLILVHIAGVNLKHKLIASTMLSWHTGRSAASLQSCTASPWKRFLASPDAQEVMSVCHSLTLSVRVSRLD